jgi:hypothetical protein
MQRELLIPSEELGPVGHIRFGNAGPQPLRYARQTVADGTRTVVLFTDVPLQDALDSSPGGSDTSSVNWNQMRIRRSPDERQVIEIVVAGILSTESVIRLSKVRPAH